MPSTRWTLRPTPSLTSTSGLRVKAPTVPDLDRVNIACMCLINHTWPGCEKNNNVPKVLCRGDMLYVSYVRIDIPERVALNCFCCFVLVNH